MEAPTCSCSLRLALPLSRTTIGDRHRPTRITTDRPRHLIVSSPRRRTSMTIGPRPIITGGPRRRMTMTMMDRPRHRRGGSKAKRRHRLFAFCAAVVAGWQLQPSGWGMVRRPQGASHADPPPHASPARPSRASPR